MLPPVLRFYAHWTSSRAHWGSAALCGRGKRLVSGARPPTPAARWEWTRRGQCPPSHSSMARDRVLACLPDMDMDPTAFYLLNHPHTPGYLHQTLSLQSRSGCLVRATC